MTLPAATTPARNGQMEVPETTLAIDYILESISKGYIPPAAQTINLGPYGPRLISLGWQITGIYLPMNVVLQLAGTKDILEALTATAEVTGRLLRDGSVVWIAQEQRELKPNIHAGNYEGAPDTQEAAWTISDDLTNPIPCNASARLALQLEMAVAARTDEGGEPENMTAQLHVQQGLLRYLIEGR